MNSKNTNLSYSLEEIKEVITLKNNGLPNTSIASIVFGSPTAEYKVRRILKRHTESHTSDDLDEGFTYTNHQYIRSLEKQQQRLRDTNASLRTLKRKTYREDTELESIYKSFMDLLKGKDFTPKALSKPFSEAFIDSLTNTIPLTVKQPKAAVIQLSDLHFGEGVSYEGSNGVHNMQLASFKLSKFAVECVRKISVEIESIDTVLIACTGDMVNSDRRPDEVLSNTSPRSEAALDGFYLLKQFIEFVGLTLKELKPDIKIRVASVVGNESRLNKDFGWSNHTATDNFDYIIHMFLMEYFNKEDSAFGETIKCLPITDKFEQVISLLDNSFNLLITHGNNKLQSKNNIESEVQKIIGRYATTHSIRVDFVIFGHIHSTEVSDYYARSASLVGGNGYSTKNLNFISKASQNLYFIDSNKEIQTCVIPLNDTSLFNKENSFRVLSEMTNVEDDDSFKLKTKGSIKEIRNLHSL